MRDIWQDVFFAALRRFGKATDAAEIAGVHRSRVYQCRDAHADFARRWDDALAAFRAAEGEALRRRLDER